MVDKKRRHNYLRKERFELLKSILDCTTLNNGIKIAWLGLEFYQVSKGIEVINAVKAA
ncbi:MAG: hypothetical protein N2489_05755 [Clostridia bacterium]|nr:hypothetical protein [Clostridia bacterium]